MKKILATLSLLSALFAVSAAEARPPIRGAHASLTSLNVDENLHGGTRFVSGMISVNEGTETVQLILQPAYRPCPRFQICTAVMPPVYTVNLPIVSQTIDNCGIVTTIAEEDKRPVDGFLTRIVVRNYSAMVCDLHVEQPTHIELRTESSRFTSTGEAVSTYSTFTADYLRVLK